MTVVLFRSEGGGKLFSVVLDTFCRCKSLALHLQNTRSDDRVNSVLEFSIHFYIVNLGVKAIKYLKWWCGKLFSVVLDTFCNSKSWALLLQNTRSDGGGIITSTVLDTILYFKNWHFLNIKSLEVTVVENCFQ